MGVRGRWMNSRDQGGVVKEMIEWMGLLGKEGSGELGFLTLPSGWTIVPVTGDGKFQSISMKR